MSDFTMTRFDQARQSAGRVSERHLLRTLQVTLRTALTRRTLLELTPRELADIGISPSTAVAEAARLPWDTNPGPRTRIAGLVGVIQRALQRARGRRLIPVSADVDALLLSWPGASGRDDCMLVNPMGIRIQRYDCSV